MTVEDRDNALRKAARTYSKLGLRPLPVAPGEKHPRLPWTKYRTSYSFITIVNEFRQDDQGLWSMVGPAVGYLVLDCDNEAAVILWRERLGDLFEKTARVRTRKGCHLWFKIDPDQQVKGWRPTKTNDPEAVERGAIYDLQSDGQGVMLPPSRHPDDASFVYTWEVVLDAALPAPEILLRPPGEAGDSPARARRKSGRSMLAQLLLNPPEPGHRNDWHAAIAGHFARMDIPFADAYEAIGLAMNRSLPEPDEEELTLKTWQWRWEEEQKSRQTTMGTESTGYLSGDGMRLSTVVKRSLGEGKYQLETGAWANADILARGVIDSEVSGRTYAVDVQRQDGIVRPDLISPGLLGSATDTNKWLARHGVSVVAPVGDIAGKSHPGQRILRYLESQRPDAYRGVQYLGWHEGVGFVTHEGVITANGMRPHDAVMPDPTLKDMAPYHYGMNDMATAKDVLREVLTFQDSQVTAVFGAWWAACFLKGQVMTAWHHFPYFLINAASEAGKTRGFFRLMLALSGSTQFGIGTKASTRDYIGAHRNGIVHVDDPDDVDHLVELLRAAAGEAIISKKGQDNRSTVETRMVAPILLSGEAIGLSDEKAQRDRSVSIDVPSPIGRMSLSDPDRPQIDDLIELERRHPDLTDYAGTLVQLALQQTVLLKQLPELRGPAGRHNEVKAIIRMGARVLARMVDAPASGESDGYDADWIVDTVDRWCIDQRDLGAANTLLTRVMPWALADERWRLQSDGPIGNPPAYVDRSGRVWVCVAKLAAEWQKECRRRGVNDRLSNEDAIRAQLRAMGAQGPGDQKWITRGRGPEGRRARYIQIPDQYGSLILGDLPADEPGPAAPVAPAAPAAVYGDFS